MTNKQTTIRIFEKEIPLGTQTADDIIAEMKAADWSGAELNYQRHGSCVLVRAETEDNRSTAKHKLKTSGFTEKTPRMPDNHTTARNL